MNLEKQLLLIHSKENTILIRDYIFSQPPTFRDLMTLFTNSEYRLTQRTAWVVGMIGNEKPEWFYPYFGLLLKSLEKPKHDSVARNVYRTLQFLEIPEEHQGLLFDLCIRDLLNPKSAIAIKVFCMTVAFNITKIHSELKAELAAVIENQLPYASTGQLSRSMKLLKILKKETNKV